MALEEGWQKGLQKGSQRTLTDFLAERFGPLSNAVSTRVGNMSEEEVSRIIKAAARANSLKELNLE